LFQANSALGILPFEALTSRQVYQSFPAEWTHVPFRLPFFQKPCSEEHLLKVGPAGRGFQALSLTGAPITDSGFSADHAGNSLGVRPSRVLHDDLGRDFARPPLTRFGSCSRKRFHSPGVPECQSVFVPLIHVLQFPVIAEPTTLIGFPHRLAPVHTSAYPSGL
jgi:hypothetical protein